MGGLAYIQAKSLESSPAVNNFAKFYPCHVPVVSPFSGGVLMDFHNHCTAHGGRKWQSQTTIRQMLVNLESFTRLKLLLKTSL